MSHRIAEELVELMAPLWKKIYKRNSAGCCLHVIIDDGNWGCTMDDGDLKHKDCRELYALIQEMDMEDRNRLDDDAKHVPYLVEQEDEDCPHCGRSYDH